MPAVPGSHLKAFVYDLHLHRLGTDEPLQLGDVQLFRAALFSLWKREGRPLRAVSFQVGRMED